MPAGALRQRAQDPGAAQDPQAHGFHLCRCQPVVLLRRHLQRGVFPRDRLHEQTAVRVARNHRRLARLSAPEHPFARRQVEARTNVV